MFRITEDPSSGSLVQCLAKNYKNGCIVSVDTDVVTAYAVTILIVSTNYVFVHKLDNKVCVCC